jgi:DNA-binding PadR family transcriptional regulator
MHKKELIIKVGTRGLYKITDSGLKALNDNMHDAWKQEPSKA